MKAYEQLKRAGKVRFAGIATHRNEPAVIRAAAKSGFWDVVLTSYNFRQSHREEVRAAIHEAAQAGLGIIAMKTQAGVYWDCAASAEDQHEGRAQVGASGRARAPSVPGVLEPRRNGGRPRRDAGPGAAAGGGTRPAPRRAAGLPGLYCQQCAPASPSARSASIYRRSCAATCTPSGTGSRSTPGTCCATGRRGHPLHALRFVPRPLRARVRRAQARPCRRASGGLAFSGNVTAPQSKRAAARSFFSASAPPVLAGFSWRDRSYAWIASAVLPFHHSTDIRLGGVLPAAG